MSRKANETDLAGLLCLLHRFHRAAFPENPVRIIEAQRFMELKQIDVVSLQSLQRVIKLVLRVLLSAAIDLGHQKNFLPITAL